MAKAVMTETGRRKLCKAHAGDITLPTIAQMAFGDGGVDENGEVLEMTGKETGLKHELFRGDIDRHLFAEDQETTCKYFRRLGKTDLAGNTISEIGLFDSDGDLVAYRICPPKAKDADEEFDFNIDEVF